MFINRTNIKVPKKYHHMIDEIYKANPEDGGYWLITHDDYFIGYEDYGVHIGRYDTVKDTLEAIRTIEPMDA